nr:hypothetical protein [Tanacetum cinerariifolium]
MSRSPEPRRGHSESPRERDLEKKMVFKRLEKGVFHRLGDKGKSTSAYSNNSRHRSYHSSHRDIESCYQSSRSREIEFAFEKHHNKRASLLRTKALSESKGSAGGQWKSKTKRQKSSVEDDLHIKTYDGSEDPKDHLKVFQAAAKMERWAMEIEEIRKVENLSHLIKELNQSNGKDQAKAAKKGETLGKEKPLAILMVQPWQRVAKQKITQTFYSESVISFPPLGEKDGTEGPMIIKVEMGGHFVYPLPMLTAPKEKEKLVIYLAAAKEAISAVLMTERDQKQMPIYFVSHALQGPKINYNLMEKLILALRFELDEHEIDYRPRTSVKGQILLDFIIERPEDDPPNTPMDDKEELLDMWILFTDGSSCIDGFEASLIITSLEEMEFTYALRWFRNRPPMLNKENYVPWSSLLFRYAKSRPNGKLIHNSIINGPYVRRMILKPGDQNREVLVIETFHVQADDELTEKELKQIEADDQAIQTILLGLPEDIYAAVDSCETGQEIWLRVQQMMKGSDIGIQQKKAKLFNEWERTQDPLALMGTSNNPYTFPVLHQDQPSLNQNYMQQPIPNPEDIIDPTTAMNMELALMAKAFKLNYLTPTNNNQRISSNPRNRKIGQPCMNMGQDRQMQMVRGNGGNQFRQYAGQNVWNLNRYNDVQNVGNQVIQNAIQNPRIQNVRNQNRLIVVSGNANQNPNGNGNLVVARAEGNETGHNANQIRCYNCRGLGHFARNCTIRLRRRNAAYLQTQLLIVRKEEAGIQLQAEEFDLMAAVVDLDEIEEVNANCILMANLQQASTLGIQTDKAPVYDSDGSAEVHNYENCYDNEIFNMFTQEEQYTELLEPIPKPHQVPQNDNNVIYEVSCVGQSGGTVEQHLANVEETRVLYDSLYNILAIKVEKVSTVNRKLSKTNVELTLSFQDIKIKKDTHNWSSSAHQKLHKIVKDEIFPIVNQVDARVQNSKIQFLKEAAKFVGEFKSLAKEADESLATHKALDLEIERLLRAVVSQDIMPVVQNNAVGETSNLQTELERTKERFENCIIKKENEYAKLWNDWINPFKPSREQKHVPNKVRATVRTNPITVSLPPVITKKVVNSDSNGLSSTGVDNTKTRRPQPRKNTKNDRVPSMSKSSRNKNKEVEVEEHHRKLLLSMNKKHMSSECNNVKLATQNLKSKVVCAMCKQCLISINHDVCLLNYVNGMTSYGKKQKENVSIQENQKKQKPKVKKPKKVGSIERLALPKPSKPRTFLRWSQTGRLFDLKGKIIASSKSKSQSNCCYPNMFMVYRLGLFQAYDRESKASHKFRLEVFGKFYDSNLEVAFRRNACFVKNLEGVDLLSENRTTNLYTINLHEMAYVSPICLMARASSTKSWLRHERLSHLNFNTINDLAKNDLVSGLPKFKYQTKHLCPSCESKDEAPEVIQTFLKRITVLFQSPVIIIRIENDTEFKNQVLEEYFDSVSISHQVSSIRTPQQNGVVERRNRTLVETARTMLIFSRAPLFLWAEVIATAYFTQNRSIIHRRFNKTPYELINGRKPNISFLHVFGALCYPKNNRKDIGKLGAKAMAFEQRSSKLELQSMTSEQISSVLDLTYALSTITTQQPTEGELDLLFEAMYDDYIGGQPSTAPRIILAAQAHQILSTIEPKNVKEAMTDPAWIESMQEELLQFKRIDVWV